MQYINFVKIIFSALNYYCSNFGKVKGHRVLLHVGNNFENQEKMDSDSEQTGLSSLDLGSESRGSSVSTALREEYEDLLRYAVVTPVVDLSNKGLKSNKMSKSQYHPSSIVPPQPQSPYTPIQPQGRHFNCKTLTLI